MRQYVIQPKNSFLFCFPCLSFYVVFFLIGKLFKADSSGMLHIIFALAYMELFFSAPDNDWGIANIVSILMGGGLAVFTVHLLY